MFEEIMRSPKNRRTEQTISDATTRQLKLPLCVPALLTRKRISGSDERSIFLKRLKAQ